MGKFCDKCKYKVTGLDGCETTTCGLFAEHRRIQEAIAARDKEWVARENKLLTAINKMIPKLKKGDTIGRITVGDTNRIEDIFICDKYGDEVPDTVYTLQSMGGKE